MPKRVFVIYVARQLSSITATLPYCIIGCGEECEQAVPHPPRPPEEDRSRPRRLLRFYCTGNWMGNLSLHAISASEEFDCKPCLYRPGCTGICIEKENTFKVMPLEDDILSASQNVGLMGQELGVTLNQILHTHTTCEPIDCNISTNEDTVLPQKEMQSCVAANLSTDTIKDETNSCLEVVQPPSLAMNAKDDISCMFVHDSILKAEIPNDEGPTPLPGNWPNLDSCTILIGE